MQAAFLGPASRPHIHFARVFAILPSSAEIGSHRIPPTPASFCQFSAFAATMISMRRFLARPSAVVLGAIGLLSP